MLPHLHLTINAARLGADRAWLQSGWTALHYAADKGHEEVVQVLLDADVVLDADPCSKVCTKQVQSAYACTSAYLFVVVVMVCGWGGGASATIHLATA